MVWGVISHIANIGKVAIEQIFIVVFVREIFLHIGSQTIGLKKPQPVELRAVIEPNLLEVLNLVE